MSERWSWSEAQPRQQVLQAREPDMTGRQADHRQAQRQGDHPQSHRGQPLGEITNWEQIRFPFDPHLQRDPDLSTQPIQRLPGQINLTVREMYTCDASGNLRVKISADPPGYSRNFLIGQSWAGEPVLESAGSSV